MTSDNWRPFWFGLNSSMLILVLVIWIRSEYISFNSSHNICLLWECVLHRHLQVSSIQGRLLLTWMYHDDVIKWQHFPRYWHIVWEIHRLLVISPHKGQWRQALMFALICTWANGWVNNRDAGDLRCHRAHYDVIVILKRTPGRMVTRSRKASKLQYVGLKLSDQANIWQAPRQCRRIDPTMLTHWGQVTHICVCNYVSIGSDNGLSSVAPFTNMV